MKKAIPYLLFLLFVTYNSFGQLAQHYKYEEKGQVLNLEERMAQTQTPGVVFYIDYGKGKDSLAIGKKSLTSEEQITMETLFPVDAISSFPLQIELLRMQTKGLVHLDDEVQKYVPELKDQRNKKHSPITIRDLLLAKIRLNGPYKPTGYEKDTPRISLETLLEKGSEDFKNGIIVKGANKKQNLECTYAILYQVIIERIHQRPIDDIIQEYIFKPIGMAHSFYATELTDEQVQQAAWGTIKGVAQKNRYRRYEALGAAGLWTTAKDISRLVRYVMNAAKGIDNRILSKSDAELGLTSQHGYRSLIFHVNENSTIYGGGNSKGFYTCLEADLSTDVIQVIFANADLVWPLVNFSFGQTANYLKKKSLTQKQTKAKLGLYIPNQISPILDRQIAKIQQIAKASNLSLEIRSAIDSIPKGITAIPALVLETPTGNSLYGGLLTEGAAIKNFIRTCRFKPIPVRPDTTYRGVHFKRNQQTIAIPFKWTGKPQLKDWENDILENLTNTISGQIGPATLYPTDRRLYLDIHPYETVDGIYFSYALFSQFNCTAPIYSNFGNAIYGLKKDKEQLVNQLINEIQKEVDHFLNREQNGFALVGLATSIPVDSNYQFGSKDSFNSKTSTSENSSISGRWTSLNANAFEQPLVQFNFPAPLNRYAGEIKKCTGQLTNEEGLLSGHFLVDLQSLTMGMAELDAKVLKQYIKVKSNPTASFSFQKAPMVFNWESTSRQQIAGTFEFLDKEIPLSVEATITPNSIDQSLSVQVSFKLEIAQTFGMPMPDGPKEAASQLEFLVNVKMQA